MLSLTSSLVGLKWCCSQDGLNVPSTVRLDILVELIRSECQIFSVYPRLIFCSF